MKTVARTPTISLTTGLHGRLSAFALFVALVVAAWTFRANLDFYHDDAYIPLRYARNLLAGQGAVWNPGERVQGYTSPLQLGLVSALGALKIDLWLASRLIGVASFGGLVAMLLLRQWRSFKAEPSDLLWVLPVVLVTSSCPIIVWSLAGLETATFCLLTAAGCVIMMAALGKSTSWRVLAAGATCFALAFLSRPDGGLFAAVSICWLVAAGRAGRLRSVVLFGAAWLAVAGPWVLWQFLYYGDVVPNTFYVKASGLSLTRLWTGAQYLAAYAMEPPYLLIALAPLLVWGICRRQWTLQWGYLLSIIVGWCAYVVVVGGDHMPAFRMILPIVVPLACLLYLSLQPIVVRSGRRVATAILLTSLAASVLQVRRGSLNPQREDNASRVGTVIGRYIEGAWPAGSLVALNTAGSTPYYAPDLRFLDMLGLNDSHIARRKVTQFRLELQRRPGHAKGDGAYVLSMAPDYVILGPAEGRGTDEPLFLSDLEIAEDPSFGACYRKREVLLTREDQPFIGHAEGFVFTYYERVKG